VTETPAPFTELALEYEYETPRALPAFYVPVLERAQRYDRTCGYFRASSLAIAAQGVARFVSNGGQMRLLCGVELLEAELSALQGDAPLPAAVEQRLRDALVTTNDVEQHRLGVLAWLVREGRLEIQLAIPKQTGSNAYFHEKSGLFEDFHGNTICINGSNNESATGWEHNFESFWVRASWKESPEAMHASIAAIEKRFVGELQRFRRISLPEAIGQELVKYAPAHEPHSDISEPLPRGDRATLAAFIKAAPQLPNGPRTLEATSAVTPFPHQRENVQKLAGTYPRSWLLADEVGLGKTISAGLALRELLLARRVKRVLVLAPANVCVQWQDELFEKFGLWVRRYADQRIYGAHPDDVVEVPAAANPYAENDVLLVSSHLARGDAQRRKLLDAPPYDLIVVDEAHHARRRGADPNKRETTKLLRLLDDVRANAHARALWLLTATPMQVDPVELYDLLAHVADDTEVIGRDYVQFERFYKQLAQPLKTIAWPFLARRVSQMPRQLDDSERHVLANIEKRVGAYDAEQIRRIGEVADPDAMAQALDPVAQRELVAFIRQRGPIARYVLRHGRGTLRRYQAMGILNEPIAERSVMVRTVDFSPQETQLYTELDDMIDRLSAAHGTTQAAGFILTTYRRRLTSSWAAIYESLRRRVEGEAALAASVTEADVSADDELAEEVDDATGHAVDPRALALSTAELDELRAFVGRLEAMTSDDGKLDALLGDIDHARMTGQPIIVFTQYTDTLNHLLSRLIASYGPELATYTGEGGRWYAKPVGDERTTKQELVEAVRSTKVTVLLCTDAASEGLNLQAASKLINYDLPWNPMRIEQRIGRIDRIGQPAAFVEIVNYTIPGTVEEDVYQALAQRIDLFDGLVGELQPILGAVESSFKTIYRQPRSERANAIKVQLDAIDARRKELEKGGVNFEEGVDGVVGPDEPPAFDLVQFAHTLRDDLRIDVDHLPHPTTTVPHRASRDAAGWRALATLGHPDLQERIDTIAAENPSASLQIAESGVSAAAARADRTPPELVNRLDDLVDLQPAVAVEDAQDLAAATAQTQDQTYQAAVRRWDTHRRQRERRQLLADLTTGIHHMLALETVASGDAAVEVLWSSLITRHTPKLCGSLPRLLKEAGLTTNEVLASYAPAQFEVDDADNGLLEEARHLKSWWERWQAAA
jgi:superfamily II DNA or RNA helicase